MTFSEAVRACLSNLDHVKKSAAATLVNYDRTFQQFRSHLRTLGLSDDCRHFTVETVSSFLEDLGKRGCKASTLANKRHALSTLARVMLKRKDGRGRPLLTENVALLTEAPPEVRPATKFLSEEELRALFATPCSDELNLVRHVLLHSWVRRAEACAANVGDVVEHGGNHFLKIAPKGRKRSGEEPVSIPLSPETVDRLMTAQLNRGMPKSHEPLLVDERGKRYTPSQMTQAMIRLGHKAGIKQSTSPHVLRHTSATIANSEGVDPTHLAALLAHRGTRHVARYVHVLPQRLSAIRDQQSGMFSRYMDERQSDK
jgi:integrase/recombinase XerD